MRLTTRLLSMTGEVAAALAAGHRLRGKVGSYKVVEQYTNTKERNVWMASAENARQVLIKRDLPHLMGIERNVLEIVRNHRCIRQMIDYIEDPPSLVLEYLDDNLLDVCSQRRLKTKYVKVVARTVLEALALLHEEGFVHTNIKPDNLLMDYSSDEEVRFNRVVLGDCSDVYRFNPNLDPLAECHVIGAPIFRSPEAHLNLRWGPPTDIWSLGATLISLALGGNGHIFSPAKVSVDNEYYGFWVLVEQVRRFGPFNPRFEEITDPERLSICTAATRYIQKKQRWLPFYLSVDKRMARWDRDFITKMMQLDPRNRPTARELLQDDWISS